jgi:hypothetical protein
MEYKKFLEDLIEGHPLNVKFGAGTLTLTFKTILTSEGNVSEYLLYLEEKRPGMNYARVSILDSTPVVPDGDFYKLVVYNLVYQGLYQHLKHG